MVHVDLTPGQNVVAWIQHLPGRYAERPLVGGPQGVVAGKQLMEGSQILAVTLASDYHPGARVARPWHSAPRPWLVESALHARRHLCSQEPPMVHVTT